MSAIKVNVLSAGGKGNHQNDTSKEENNKVSEHFKEYADGTSLHGIKYIGEDGRHPFERCIKKIIQNMHYAQIIDTPC